jgi:hypothetical protein
MDVKGLCRNAADKKKAVILYFYWTYGIYRTVADRFLVQEGTHKMRRKPRQCLIYVFGFSNIPPNLAPPDRG